MKALTIIPMLALLGACSLKNTHMYGSDTLSQEAQAVISAVGIYNNGGTGIQVTAINGKPVDVTKTASFLVPSGTYEITLHLNKDLTLTSGHGGGLGVRKQVADATVNLVTQGGHTYIPNVFVQGDRVRFFFDDKGLNFPRECLHLYEVVNNASNPGLKLYQTDEKCEI